MSTDPLKQIQENDNESRFGVFDETLRSRQAYVFHSQTFVIFRMVNDCSVCSGPVSEPHKDGDTDITTEYADVIQCEHHDNVEYVALCNQAVNGQIQMIKRQHIPLKSGTILVLVEWGVPISKPKKSPPTTL